MLRTGGRLRIVLEAASNGVTPRLSAPSALELTSALVGKPAEEAARVIPLVYNVCAAAQESAVRSALDLPLDETLFRRVALESLREHVLKLAIVWPQLAGEMADREAPALAARAFDDDDVATALRQALFAPFPGAPENLDAFDAFVVAGKTAPARMLARLADGWNPDWGRVDDIDIFEPHEPVDWPRPTQKGAPVDNSQASRVAETPLLRQIEARQGRGLVWRIAARLVEVDRLLQHKGEASSVTAHGAANAARGVMMVQGSITPDGRIASLARLSPTDFLIAPGGVLERALATLDKAGNIPLRNVAQMVVETIDPCVATELEVIDA